MWLGQRPEFGSSNLAVRAWAPVMVPRLRGSVIARSQGSTRGRLSTAGSVGVGRAGRLPARSGVSGYWFEQALAWVSVILDFFFWKDKNRKPHNTYCISPVCRGSRILGVLPASCSWRQKLGAGFFVLRLGLLAAGSKY